MPELYETRPSGGRGGKGRERGKEGKWRERKEIPARVSRGRRALSLWEEGWVVSCLTCFSLHTDTQQAQRYCYYFSEKKNIKSFLMLSLKSKPQLLATVNGLMGFLTIPYSGGLRNMASAFPPTGCRSTQELSGALFRLHSHETDRETHLQLYPQRTADRTLVWVLTAWRNLSETPVQNTRKTFVKLLSFE